MLFRANGRGARPLRIFPSRPPSVAPAPVSELALVVAGWSGHGPGWSLEQYSVTVTLPVRAACFKSELTLSARAGRALPFPL